MKGNEQMIETCFAEHCVSGVAKIIDNRTIQVFDLTQFDIHAIMNSGQVFRKPPCEIIQQNDIAVIKSTGDKDSKWLWNYFDLDTDYNVIKKELQQFKALQEPMKFGAGIRILRQPFCEVVISFIVSANNNIPRIKKTIQQIDFKNLAKYTEENFKEMGCGYRAPYLVKTIKQIKQIDSQKLGALDNKDLRKELLQLSGVGPKVADCIMLFAFGRLDAAPVDVHIRRAIEYLGKEQTDAIFSNKYAGIAQQYIFYYLQYLKKELQ